MNEETKHLISLLYKGSLSQYGKRKLADIVEKQENRIKELEADLYSANKIIDEYIEERKHLNGGINKLITKRRKWKNRYYKAKTKLYKLKKKMIADKMEQFDDYTIYLIESYLNILEE